MKDLSGKTLLGRYQVVEFLGRGGNASVYKAWDERRLSYLSLKALNEELAVDRVFMKRFQREAEILAGLHHPNIVRFYSLEQEGSLAFMLLDYIEGKTLQREIFDNGGPLSLERVLALARPVCAALQYAHDQGLVHCDLKPGNILIEQSGKVLLTDFGIARVAGASPHTMIGLGTPAYMSPEQILGRDPTPQSDLYAFGVVLYEMVSGGQRPFTGDQATEGSADRRIRWEHLHMQAPSPRQHNPALSPALESVILRCLAKNPAGRFSGAAELLNALEAALRPNALPVGSAPPAQAEDQPTMDAAQTWDVLAQPDELAPGGNRLPSAPPPPEDGSTLLAKPPAVSAGAHESSPPQPPPKELKALRRGRRLALAGVLALIISIFITFWPRLQQPLLGSSQPGVTLAAPHPPAENTQATRTPAPAASLRLEEPSACLAGPGSEYRVVAELAAGARLDVSGTARGDWWLVQLPDPPPEQCWVQGGQFSGDSAAVPLSNFRVTALP